MNLAEQLRRLRNDLDELGVGWCVAGGFAVSARTEPRTTVDVDALVSVVDDREAERVLFALQGRGYKVTVCFEQEAVGRLATVRLDAPAPGALVVDLLFATCGVEPEIVASASPAPLPGLGLAPVASLAALIAMKTLSASDRRAKDFGDLQALLAHATSVDLAEARDLLVLIERRGFSRGLDLVARMANFVERFGPSPSTENPR